MIVKTIKSCFKHPRSRHRSRSWTRNKILRTFCWILTLVIINLVIRNIRRMYTIIPRYPVQTWMDPREETLIITYLDKFNQKRGFRSATMLEFGAGIGTFIFSAYVRRYVSIEYDVKFCRKVQSVAADQPNRSIIISYMKSYRYGFIEIDRYVQNPPKSHRNSFIHIFCVVPTYSMLFHRFWTKSPRSSYAMYENYINFVPTFLSNLRFDFILLDGRARPQIAYVVLEHLKNDSKVFVHDWNRRQEYHVITREFYNIVDQQIKSVPFGGGGLVVLEKKSGVTGKAKLDNIQWKHGERPSWWL